MESGKAKKHLTKRHPFLGIQEHWALGTGHGARALGIGYTGAMQERYSEDHYLFVQGNNKTLFPALFSAASN